MQRSDEADPVKLIENMDVWADVWMQEVAPNMHHVTSNGVAPTCATPNEPTLDGWADVWMQEFADRSWPTHVTSNGVAPTYATPNLGRPVGPQIRDAKTTGEMSGRDIGVLGDLMQGFTPPHVTSNGVAPPYATPNGDLSRAVQLSVDAKAVRAFMLSQTRIDGDLIDELIQKGGVSDLAALKYLKEEDLTDPVRSIISPRVIPVLQARLLIKESIPKLFSPPTHVRIDLLSSPVDLIHERHAIVNAEHVITHGLPPLSQAHGTLTDSSGVSPTLSRGGLQAPSSTRSPQQQQQCSETYPGGYL